MQLYLLNRKRLGFSGGSIVHRLIPRIMSLLFRPQNTLSNSRRNVSFHYDTSNELFQSFLSADMNYSCAMFSDDLKESLQDAQERKVLHILKLAKIESHHHILDIGCGWGHLAITAAKTRGCRVTGLTLSTEQKAFAEAKIQRAGVGDHVEILLCDYRNTPVVPGGYDRVVSIEMLEHVGEKYLKTYFGHISRLLRPEGGIMVVQSSTNIRAVSEYFFRPDFPD
jgi:cyclopropane-fatty-acyl-phospholipid synthase